MVWFSQLFKSFSQFIVIYTVKGFSAVIEEEVDFCLFVCLFLFFLESLCFSYNTRYVCNLISGPSAISKSSLYIQEFSVHKLLKPSLKNFEHYLASMRNEDIVTWFKHSLALRFFGLELNLTFSCPVATEFSKFSGILSAAL